MGRRLSQDLALQVIAVLLALVLWMQATSVQNPVDRFTFDGVPVSVGPAPEGTVLTGAPRPSKVNVTVKCRRRVADKLKAGDFVAAVSLQDGRLGSADYPVDVEAPPGTEVVEISPAAVTVTLERMSSSKVSVQARLVGTAPAGYSPGPPSVSPAMVAVRGPASEVSRVAAVLAEFDVSGLTAETSGPGRLVAVDAAGATVADVTFAPAGVTVTVPVVALPAAESVDVEPTLTGSPAQGYAVLRITCEPLRVQVRPAPGKVLTFDHLDTAPVNISGSTSDVRALVELVVPPDVAEVTPSRVEVVVEIGASLTLTALPVEVRNCPAGLSASAAPSAVDVVVRGPRALLDRLASGDVKAWVDASNLPAGQAPAKVNVAFPDWAEGELEALVVTPAEVLLTLER